MRDLVIHIYEFTLQLYEKMTAEIYKIYSLLYANPHRE